MKLATESKHTRKHHNRARCCCSTIPWCPPEEKTQFHIRANINYITLQVHVACTWRHEAKHAFNITWCTYSTHCNAREMYNVTTPGLLTNTNMMYEYMQQSFKRAWSRSNEGSIIQDKTRHHSTSVVKSRQVIGRLLRTLISRWLTYDEHIWLDSENMSTWSTCQQWHHTARSKSATGGKLLICLKSDGSSNWSFRNVKGQTMTSREKLIGKTPLRKKQFIRLANDITEQ